MINKLKVTTTILTFLVSATLFLTVFSSNYWALIGFPIAFYRGIFEKDNVKVNEIIKKLKKWKYLN